MGILRIHSPRSLVQIRQSLPDGNFVLLEQCALLTEILLLQLQKPQPSLVLDLRVLLTMLPKVGCSCQSVQSFRGINQIVYGSV